jgi:hypothetical protein
MRMRGLLLPRRLDGRMPDALGDGLSEMSARLVGTTRWDLEPDSHLNDLDGLAHLCSCSFLAAPALGEERPYRVGCLLTEFFEEGLSDDPKNQAQTGESQKKAGSTTRWW